jgi:hypothetical protein
VVCEHLRLVFRAPERLDPFGGQPVLLGAVGARNLAVRDVPDEDVAEGVLVLALDRRTPFAAHELLQHERVQTLVEHRAVPARERRERARPEGFTEDRRVLKERLLVGRQEVEARRDQPLHGLRQPSVVLESASLHEHARELLRVEGIASRAGEQRLLGLRRQDRALEQLGDEPRGLVVRERREREGEGVRLASTPSGPTLEQLRPCAANDEQRNAGRPVDDVVDEVEKRLVRPVQVLDDQDERALFRERLEKRPPRGERLAALTGGDVLLGTESHERTKVRTHPLVRSDDRELLFSRGGRVRLQDPGLRLHDLAESPERDPFAVREAAPLPPEEDLRVAVHDLGELEDEPRLPDSGDAHDRHELRRELLAHPRQGSVE